MVIITEMAQRSLSSSVARDVLDLQSQSNRSSVQATFTAQGGFHQKVHDIGGRTSVYGR